MKAITSRSLLPLSSWLRICSRRSTASGAFESASVWFWHTRQRSSWASALARFSRLRCSASLATGLQLPHQRRDLLLGDFRRQRSDVLVADHALAVDHVGLGHAVDAVVDGDAAGGVVGDQLERIAVARQPRQRILARVL